MRRRFASLLAAFAALLWADPVPAQPQPAPPLLAFAVTGAAAAQPAPRPVSLIVGGRWLDATVIGQPACPADVPDGEQCLSLNVIADVRLGNVRTLAGPDVPRLLTARFEFHALPADGYYQVLLVRPSAVERGRYDGVSLGRMRRNRQVCVERSWLTNHDVPLPARARIAGDNVCFRPYFASR